MVGLKGCGCGDQTLGDRLGQGLAFIAVAAVVVIGVVVIGVDGVVVAAAVDAAVGAVVGHIELWTASTCM